MITTVITSCGRTKLLERTLASFTKFADLKTDIFIIEDSPKTEDQLATVRLARNYDAIPIINTENLGQIKSIDKAYSFVETPYIFHIENDWEFLKPGFLSDSLLILEADKSILQVWLRGLTDTNGHPVEKGDYVVNGVRFRYMETLALGGNWHGFSWNPGLRRKADYDLVKPFEQFIKPNDFNALTECRIGQKYFDLGFRAVILLETYCKHIG